MDKFIAIILSIKEYKILYTFAQNFGAIRELKLGVVKLKYETPYGMFNLLCYIQYLELSIQLLGLCINSSSSLLLLNKKSY
jgi:hypothetical protein